MFASSEILIIKTIEQVKLQKRPSVFLKKQACQPVFLKIRMLNKIKNIILGIRIFLHKLTMKKIQKYVCI